MSTIQKSRNHWSEEGHVRTVPFLKVRTVILLTNVLLVSISRIYGRLICLWTVILWSFPRLGSRLLSRDLDLYSCRKCSSRNVALQSIIQATELKYISLQKNNPFNSAERFTFQNLIIWLIIRTCGNTILSILKETVQTWRRTKLQWKSRQY